MDNHYNKVFLSFDPINPEFSSGCRIIDISPSHFSFHLSSTYNNQSLKAQIHQLNNLAFKSLSISSNTLVITDASIKNNVAISILHIYVHNKSVIKTLHYTVNIISIEAESFAIRCSINQATNYNNISKIIVITDSIHTARKIFNMTLYPFQKYIAAILNELRVFFSCHQENLIKFWECSSQCNWFLYKAVDLETKSFNPILLFPRKLS